jgi:hypothetical protein
MNVEQWSAALLEAAQDEFAKLVASVPARQRALPGELKRWSPKDEMAHLVYWLELYAAKLKALRAGREPEDVRNYQERNDAIWPLRRDWTWGEVEQAWQRALQQVAAEWARRSEPEQRALLRSLIYELVDHPLHHYVRLYGKFRQPARGRAMLARTEVLLSRRGAARWTATPRRKLKRWALELQA